MRLRDGARAWYNGGMRIPLFLMATCAALSASAKVAGPVALGVSPFADTETSTNMPLPACAGVPHCAAFALDFAGAPSNAVEIAFGVDADCDGALAPDETRIVVGWECADWFVRDEAEGATLSEPAAAVAGPQTLSVQMRIGRDGRPSSFAARGGNAPLFADLAVAPPAWFHDCAWNLCRVTSRGMGVQGASFVVSSTPDGFKVFVR